MKKSWILFICVASLAFSGCGKNYLAEKEFYKAEKLLKSLNLSEGLEPLDEAAAAFQAIADKYPSTPKALESLRLISSIRLKQEKFEESRKALIAIIQSFAASQDAVAEARYRIAELYEYEKRWDLAEKYYWEVAEFNALSQRGLYAPVKILLNYKQLKDDRGLERAYVKALDHYNKLLKQLGPIDAAAAVRNYLAISQLVKGENQSALENWLSIPADFPKTGYAPMAILAAAELYWKMEDFDKSREFYNRYYDEYPEHPLAGRTALTVGMAHHARNEFQLARDWYSKALTYFEAPENASEKSEVKLLMARTYQDEVLWDEADSIYLELEELYPNTSASMQVPLMRADYYYEAGETEKSMAILDEAILQYQTLEATEKDPKLVGYARRFRSQALARKGAWAEIMEDLEKRMEEETTPTRKGRWLFLKALMTQNRLQDFPKAIEIYERFLAEFPGHPLEARAKTQLETLRKPA